mmetsp:Transcript_12301/g.33814  ORF Transcript_12301/g.33814 Transcript_12301/m.33814 type:complete len:185 (-) Transcript_12301:400-954(-)
MGAMHGLDDDALHADHDGALAFDNAVRRILSLIMLVSPSRSAAASERAGIDPQSTAQLCDINECMGHIMAMVRNSWRRNSTTERIIGECSNNLCCANIPYRRMMFDGQRNMNMEEAFAILLLAFTAVDGDFRCNERRRDREQVRQIGMSVNSMQWLMGGIALSWESITALISDKMTPPSEPTGR